MSVETDRALALYHLRVNPHNRTQIRQYLSDGCNGRCAVGLVAEAFGIPLPTTPITAENDPTTSWTNEDWVRITQAYAKIESRLQDSAMNIWTRNDSGLSFTEIADAVEKDWKERDSA